MYNLRFTDADGRDVNAYISNEILHAITEAAEVVIKPFVDVARVANKAHGDVVIEYLED